MNKSPEIKELAKALATFHAQVGKVKKEAQNPFFKSKYASLSNILDVIAEPLQKAGLVFSQFPDEFELTTILIHTESGQYLEASYAMPVAKENDPQAVGSAISYARRYAIGAILCLNIDEDDDAEKAMNRTKMVKYKLTKNSPKWGEAVKYVAGGGDTAKIAEKYDISNKDLMDLAVEAGLWFTRHLSMDKRCGEFTGSRNSLQPSSLTMKQESIWCSWSLLSNCQTLTLYENTSTRIVW